MIDPPRYPGDLMEHLRSFRHLAERVTQDPRGAYEAAAAANRVDASVLRRRIQTLEAHLGVPLFEGRASGLRLSSVGQAVAEESGRVFAAVSRLHDKAGVAPSHLTFACTGTITTELLPEVFHDLQRKFPELSLRVRRAGADAAQRLLQSGAADVAVVRAADAPEGIEAEELCRDRLWLVLPKTSPLAQRRRVDARAMAALDIVGYRERSSTRRRVMSVLGPLGAEVRFEVDGRAAALRFVSLGLGAAFLSLLPGHRVRDEGVVVRDVSRLFPASHFWLCRRTGAAPNAVEEAAMHSLRTRARARR